VLEHRPSPEHTDLDERFSMSYDKDTMPLPHVSKAQREALRDAAGGRCEICDTPFTTMWNNRENVDHCHKTGAIRGLLCRSCNQAIGLLKDDPRLLRAAIRYLKKSPVWSHDELPRKKPRSLRRLPQKPLPRWERPQSNCAVILLETPSPLEDQIPPVENRDTKVFKQSYSRSVGTVMTGKLGIRAAARLAGENPVVLYAAVARQSLHADVVDGQLEFEAEDIQLWRKKLDAEADARLQASISARDANFKSINRRRS
jgi:Recombination endonuclease VII